jgi:hypothetical protein
METVTIPRDVYETLANAYNSVKQRDYADSIAATVRTLTDEELAALPTAMGDVEPDVSESAPGVAYYVEEMLRDGTIYEDTDGDYWCWDHDTLKVRETTEEEPDFYKYMGMDNPNMYAPFTPTSRHVMQVPVN